MTYAPSFPGVHVCGASADEREPVTVADFPARSDEHARLMFLAGRAECEARDGDPRDLIVDLNLHPDIGLVEDFWMTRQMLERLRGVMEIMARQAA